LAAHAHIHHYLFELWRGHRASVTELLDQRRKYLARVSLFESGSHAVCSSLLFLDRRAALFARPVAHTILENLMPDPGWIAAMRTQHHHIRNIDSRLTFENAPLHTAPAIG